MLTYDVKLYTIRQRSNRKKPFELRWKVGPKPHSKSYVTKTLATGRLAELRTAMKDGEQFDVETGLPASELRKLTQQQKQESWFEHAKKYAKVTWPGSSAKERAARADGLATITPALVADHRGAPPAAELRTALSCWAFNVSDHQGEIPEKFADALAWIARKSVPVSQLEDSDTLREALTAITLKLDGKRAADNTIKRKYSTLSGAIGYAIERKLLTANPLKSVKWTPPETDDEIDFRYVPAPRQARELIEAVRTLGLRGRHLATYYGCTNWAAMRPAEVAHLRLADCTLPKTGWGLIVAPGSSPRVGSRWTDDGQSHEERGLKHRPRKATREIPIPPVFVRMLREHVDEFGLGLDGRLFQAAEGGLISTKETSEVWKKARELALTPVQVGTPFADVPYSLRATCVSGWLAAGVDPAEVAHRAGHSITVLFKFYAKVLDGRKDRSNTLIERFLDQEYGGE
ncbi:tyrosine-type recombinase/integrase [Kitasatospora sp. NPDC091335]|uniref:tyrosine-type recombinase/integrase n=1 Tax=Kitasatospora sp. NPDC091335 TaxID=3364085 RepID=UPI003814D871